MPRDPFENALARRVWASRYRWDGADGDDDVRDTWRRVARALASVETQARDGWTERFHALLADFRFLPGGRILAGAGTRRPVTLFNCFVGAAPDGSLEGLLECLQETARISLAGGGVGTDFSSVPGHDAALRDGAALLGGPLPLLPLWDALCATLGAGRTRRGAMMGTLRCDHPDIEAFITAKKLPGDLPRFTLSVLASDEFMDAARAGRDWPLLFPPDAGEPGVPDPGRVWRRIPARALWQAILQRNHDRSEPGLLFIDTIRRLNPLAYAEQISAVNPCSEVPLPSHGACDLGSFNLTRFVRAPFSAAATFDRDALLADVPAAVRLLDNVYERSMFPTPRQAQVARASRRIGLGITGLADTLILLGMRYDTIQARRFAGELMRELCIAAYRASVDLAREKGAFPQFQAGEHLRGEFVSRLPADLREDIARYGLRNSHLLAIAPAGSISLLANGVSSGLEPLPALRLQRRVRLDPQCVEAVSVESYALTRYRRRFGPDAPLPASFVDAGQIAPEDQLEMQAALQQHVDNAIAKTVTVPADCSLARYDALLRHAHAIGLKGCTTYRPGCEVGAVLSKQRRDPMPTQVCA
jgi:ribonucleoside-diphosphate reductase alpha chain